MKSYTDIEQSKKLAEILPIESADMLWTALNWQETEYYVEIKQDGINQPKNAISCWSLAVLLDNIPQVKLDSIKQYNRKLWRCCAYFASDWHNSDWCDNPVDACYEMIIKLKELNLL